MLDTATKRRIDTARDILVGKVPDPKSQVEQITIALIYKFMDDMDAEAEELGGKRKFFTGDFARYGWAKLMSAGIGGHELIGLYGEGITTMPQNPGIPALFRDIFKNAYLPYRDPETLKSFLKIIDEFSYDHSERLGDAFEYLLSVLGSQGDAGQFRTPRHIIDFIVAVIDPKKHETVLDPACGTGGFLVEAYRHLEKQCKTVQDRKTLQTQSILGSEAKSLPYLLAQMNLLLHGLESPQIDPGNSLRVPLKEIGDRDRVDIILTNPPFGGEEERGIRSNFPEDKQTSETALLFLQLIMRKLKRQPKPGRAGVVVPNGTLFGDGVCARIKEELLKDFNLHTIVRLPNGVFAPYTSIPTNLLFFDRSGPTKEVWYYEHKLPEGKKNYTKTRPLQYDEFAPCLAWWKKREENERAWKVPASEILTNGCNLDRKNPRGKEDITHLPPEQLVESIITKERRILEIMDEVKRLLEKGKA